MMYAMWLALGLAWFDGTHTGRMHVFFVQELRRIDAMAAEAERLFREAEASRTRPPPRPIPRPMLPPRRVPPQRP
jgi:hypothetical protein